MGHTRMYVTALTALLVPASLGVVTVHASPTCEKFVRTHVTVPVRNTVSKATAVAWEKWRVGHPNWKPNPKIKRPRYRMTQRESLDKVAFACEVPTDPKHLDIMFPVAELLPPQPDVTTDDVPPIETSDVSVPYSIPPVTPAAPPVAELVMPPPMFMSPPFVPPMFGGPQLPPSSRPSLPPGQGSGSPNTPVTGTTLPPTLPIVPATPGAPDTPVVTVTPVVPVTPTPTVPVVPEVPVAPVPEPSSMVLTALGMGSAGMMSVRARRSKSAV